MRNLCVDALQVSRSYTPITFPGKNEPRVVMQIKDCTVFSKTGLSNLRFRPEIIGFFTALPALRL